MVMTELDTRKMKGNKYLDLPCSSTKSSKSKIPIITPPVIPPFPRKIA